MKELFEKSLDSVFWNHFQRNKPVMPAGTAKTIIGIWISSVGMNASMRRLECSFQEAIMRNTKSTKTFGSMLKTLHSHGQSKKNTHHGLTNIQM